MSTDNRAVNQMKLEFPSLPENVAFARTAVAVFASQLEFTLDELDEIKVAVSEAVSNCVIHAYPEDNGTITVLGRILPDDSLELSIIDSGVGIKDVDAAFEPAFTTQPEERTGLGLVFIKEYMDWVDLKSEIGRGTVLVMRKHPTSRGGGSEESDGNGKSQGD